MNRCPPDAAARAGRFRPTRADVSVGAFSQNVRALRALIGRSTRLMAVLKADAYGHGAVALAPAAIEAGADSIGVSSLEEGIILREAGVRAPILLLGSIYPLENFAFALRHDLTPTVNSLESAQHLAAIAEISGKPASFHLKIDTGMGRLGVSPSGARAVLAWVAGQKSLRLAGVYTHFASADSDAEFTAHQLSEFAQVRKTAAELGFTGVTYHAANSAAALNHADARLDLVRPGISLYGSAPVALPAGVALQPVLSWKTAIVFSKRLAPGASVSYSRRYRVQKETEIATLPVGYGDGVPRCVWDKAHVLIKGQRRPVVGVVTMDHVMVDVTGVGAEVGDEVVLIGRQGAAEITASEWAGWAGTIPYEIFCGISKRVPREMVA